MIGLDTNILVRYLAQDEPAQTKIATRLIERLTAEEPGFVASIVLIETVWVMEDLYGARQPEIAAIVENLLQTASLVVQDAERVWQALSRYRAGAADFADCLIERTCSFHGCRTTYTFDRKAARDSGMTLAA